MCATRRKRTLAYTRKRPCIALTRLFKGLIKDHPLESILWILISFKMCEAFLWLMLTMVFISVLSCLKPAYEKPFNSRAYLRQMHEDYHQETQKEHCSCCGTYGGWSQRKCEFRFK